MIKNNSGENTELEKLARMAYSLYNTYQLKDKQRKLRGKILDIRTQELFIDNSSYELGEEVMDFGIDLRVRENGRTVFEARGAWSDKRNMKFSKYILGEWENKIRDLYRTCVR